ncbi:MAG: hypothetical protein AAB214_08165 [Fibrobacterota bacterium]
MELNPLKFLTGKIVRPALRKLAGETGEQFRRDKELRRKVAAAAVAVARARAEAEPALVAAADNSNPLTAWQAVTRGRTIKGRGNR